MKQIRLFLLFILSLWMALPACGWAQTTQKPTTLEGWADRLTRFGKAIPQEKVFVQMDNTCYFLGDTIWFAAHTRRTDRNLPSNVSRILYVELLNQDGFLMERQLIEMRKGWGHGNFVLPDTLYAGYYELRAYTRWQLNWGITEKEHTTDAEAWFFNHEMAKEFYRDYDKLYSRVFPVYDKPQAPGEYYRDMTTRPLRRYFKSGAETPQLLLSLYPEGGQLVAGVPCRVAFEAATENGEACEGKTLPPPSLSGSGQIPAEGVATVSRGRGVFTFTPEAGQEYEFTFIDKNGRTAKAKLPKAETDGVALCVERNGEEYVLSVHTQGTAASKPLGITVMHEGRVTFFQELGSDPTAQIHYTPLLDREGQGGESGVHQATVFDADGRVWADRLFFVTQPGLLHSTLTISGLQSEYAPYSQVSLQVTAPSLTGRAGGESSSLSLAVRDAGTQDYTYDTDNILTEMLLSSEIKGFVPNASYFFEADDEEHRMALDLLMMTQGWRRFNWHEMATPGAFEFTQPAESQTQVLRGQVMNYTSREWQDEVRSIDDTTPTPYQLEKQIGGQASDLSDFRDSLRHSDDGLAVEDKYAGMGQGEVLETIIAQSYARESNYPRGSYRMRGTIAAARFNAKENDLSREMQVHAEFVQDGSDPVIGDVVTKNGNFTIQAPRFNEYCIFFLTASDTTKWKANNPHQWISMNEQDYPEFYLRIQWPYPNFVKPYDHYQTSFRPQAETRQPPSVFNPTTFETQMQTVTVRASHGGLRRLDPSKPAFIEDAYAAYNRACDAGLMEGRYFGRFHYINSLARLYMGDMNTHNTYLLEPRYDGANISTNRAPLIIDHYNHLTNLNRVKLYTDYNPRTGGDPRAIEQNVERAAIDLEAIPDDGQRVTYRDRRYILQGFSTADSFYNPDYRRTPPAEGKKDYRRTLYWNPAVQLDENGQASVSFFNGSNATSIIVDANGQAADGTLLTTGLIK